MHWFCWHDWTRWEVVENEDFIPLLQKRTCQKCGMTKMISTGTVTQ